MRRWFKELLRAPIGLGLGLDDNLQGSIGGGGSSSENITDESSNILTDESGNNLADSGA